MDWALVAKSFLFWTNNTQVDDTTLMSIVLVSTFSIGYFLLWVYYFLIKGNHRSWKEANISDRGLSAMLIGFLPFLSVSFILLNIKLIMSLIPFQANIEINNFHLIFAYGIFITYSLRRLFKIKQPFHASMKIVLSEHAYFLFILAFITLLLLSLNSLLQKAIPWISNYSTAKFSLRDDIICTLFALIMVYLFIYELVSHFIGKENTGNYKFFRPLFWMKSILNKIFKIFSLYF